MTSASTPQAGVLQANEQILLPESIACSATFTGLDPWLNFVREMYGFPVYRILSRQNDRIDGWLALVRVKHPIFGQYLTTAPFGSYGGFVYASAASRNA
jgi:hypothetical protein